MTQFEFTLHPLPSDAARCGDVDPTLALLGAQGWEIRGITALPDGSAIIALQRAQRNEAPLPDAPVLSAALAEPLTAPSIEELDAIEPPPTTSA